MTSTDEAGTRMGCVTVTRYGIPMWLRRLFPERDINVAWRDTRLSRARCHAKTFRACAVNVDDRRGLGRVAARAPRPGPKLDPALRLVS